MPVQRGGHLHQLDGLAGRQRQHQRLRVEGHQLAGGLLHGRRVGRDGGLGQRLDALAAQRHAQQRGQLGAQRIARADHRNPRQLDGGQMARQRFGLARLAGSHVEMPAAHLFALAVGHRQAADRRRAGVGGHLRQRRPLHAADRAEPGHEAGFGGQALGLDRQHRGRLPIVDRNPAQLASEDAAARIGAVERELDAGLEVAQGRAVRAVRGGKPAQQDVVARRGRTHGQAHADAGSSQDQGAATHRMRQIRVCRQVARMQEIGVSGCGAVCRPHLALS